MISVIIPAKDEEQSVADTVLQVQRTLAEIEHEVIVVDDGSHDATADCAKSAGARVISHPHNLGYGAALKTGIRAARYDTIVITDADGTYPNDQIPVLLKEYEKGFDMVVGARLGQHYRESILKNPLRMILKFLVEYTAGRKVPDVNSGLRIFSRQKAIPYFSHLCNTFSFTTSLTLAHMMNSSFVGYVPIPYYKRAGKTKVRLLRDSLRTLQYIIEAIIYYNPIKIFILISAFLGAASIVALVLVIFTKLAVLYFLGIGGILMSILVFCLGLIAVLLQKIMVKE
jgi:glycosyltransferase involved in cell wall biosynthesis